MRLAQFIRSNMEPILDEWERRARQMASARELDGQALRIYARGMLRVIADNIAHVGDIGAVGMVARHASRHGAVRLAQGFSVNDTVAEFSALRAAVMLLWTGRDGCGDAADDLARFNQAIDQAVTDALARYTSLRDYQSRLFDALLSSSPDLAFIVDPAGRIIYANKAFAEHLRVAADALPGADFYAITAAYAPEIDLHVAHVLRSRNTYCGELNIVVAPGRCKSYEYLLVPVLDPGGRSEAVAGTARDITERKEIEDRIRRSANYDHLTGLPNRSLFRERIEHETRHAARTGLPMALLFLDLDGFKDVNDRLGHEAGDQLLQEVAHRISACVRDTDTVARLGGDEFTVVLTEVTQPDKVDALCAKMLSELDKPFMLEAGEARISASIGIAMYPDDGATPDELLRQADAAMYAAKNAGRNRYHFHAGKAGAAARR